MTAPRPGGLYALRPVLSNESILGRETVTSMQKRVSASATVGGVNADLFTWDEGLPSSMFMESGVLKSPPHPHRSSVGVTDDGRLLVERVKMVGTWQGSDSTAPAPRPQPATGAARRLALHPGLGDHDARGAGNRRGHARYVPTRLPGHGADRNCGCRKACGRNADSAHRRGPRRPRDLGRPARVGRFGGPDRDRPPQSPAAVGRRRRCGRRRAGDRPEPPASLQGARVVHEQPTLASPSTHRGRPKGGRPHHLRRDRRPSAGLQHRPHQLRAGAEDGQPGRRYCERARRGRLDDDGLRRQGPEQAFRRRGTRSRRRSLRLLLRRPRAAGGPAGPALRTATASPRCRR